MNQKGTKFDEGDQKKLKYEQQNSSIYQSGPDKRNVS